MTMLHAVRAARPLLLPEHGAAAAAAGLLLQLRGWGSHRRRVLAGAALLECGLTL